MVTTYQTGAAEGPLAALGRVATDVTDAIEGYRVMEERAEADLVPVVEGLRTLHEGHAQELYARIEDLGGDPDAAGSLMGEVHSFVATARDWAGALDASAVPRILEGEERIVDSYSDAIGEDEDLTALLEDQRTALRETLDDLGG